MAFGVGLGVTYAVGLIGTVLRMWVDGGDLAPALDVGATALVAAVAGLCGGAAAGRVLRSRGIGVAALPAAASGAATFAVLNMALLLVYGMFAMALAVGAAGLVSAVVGAALGLGPSTVRRIGRRAASSSRG